MKLKLLLAWLAFVPLGASAVEVTIDGIKYDVVKKGKHAEVISDRYQGDIVIPPTIEYEGVTCNVEAIAAKAFSECKKLTSVSIPSSVTSIGSGAFYQCSSLTSVSIPAGVTVIEDETFAYCQLGSITIPSGVTKIGSKAFFRNAFTSVSIPNTVTALGTYAFSECGLLTSVTLGSGLRSISDYAFSQTALEAVTIPDNINYIGKSAFSYSYLRSVNIGSNVVGIGDHAFYGCSLLESVKIGSGAIGLSAFRDCSGLKSVVLGSGVTSIGTHAFRECSSLESIDIPASVLSIGDNAFYLCTALKSLVLHDGLQTLGNYAFQSCTSLESVTLPGTLTKIGSNVFKQCSRLTTVVVPKNITQLGSGMFSYCEELTDVYCLSVAGVDCYSSTFSNSEVRYATLHVPSILVDLYKQAPYWQEFGTIVALKAGDPGVPTPTGTPIKFDDIVAGALCIQYFDANGDLQVSREEAAAVKSFPSGQGFTETPIGSFDEFRFFTGIKSIPDYGFAFCRRLTYMILPEGLRTIGNEAFRDCASLDNITISSTVTTIGVQAFINCDELTDVLCLAATPPACDFEAFELCGNKTLHVPAASIQLYRKAPIWKEFGSIVALVPGDPGYDPDPSEGLRGDVNGDGVVDVGDIMAVINFMAGQTSGIDKAKADVNSDTQVDVGDIMAIINIMAGSTAGS